MIKQSATLLSPPPLKKISLYYDPLLFHQPHGFLIGTASMGLLGKLMAGSIPAFRNHFYVVVDSRKCVRGGFYDDHYGHLSVMLFFSAIPINYWHSYTHIA